MQISRENIKNQVLPKGISKIELRELITDLEYLCHNLDPFAELKKREQALLKKLQLGGIQDPFQLTNTLVYLTEEAINLERERLH